MTVQGLPLIKPPYALISAISLDRGEIVLANRSRRNPGDAIRNNPALKGLDIHARRTVRLQHRHPGDEEPGHRRR